MEVSWGLMPLTLPACYRVAPEQRWPLLSPTLMTAGWEYPPVLSKCRPESFVASLLTSSGTTQTFLTHVLMSLSGQPHTGAHLPRLWPKCGFFSPHGASTSQDSHPSHWGYYREHSCPLAHVGDWSDTLADTKVHRCSHPLHNMA
jgi:hypothetical protein